MGRFFRPVALRAWVTNHNTAGLTEVGHRTRGTLTWLPVLRNRCRLQALVVAGKGWAGDIVWVIGAEFFLRSWAGVGAFIRVRRIGRVFGAGGAEDQKPAAEHGAQPASFSQPLKRLRRTWHLKLYLAVAAIHGGGVVVTGHLFASKV